MTKDTDRIYDEWLILCCQTGDRFAFERLVERWQQRLFQFATIVTREPDLAREAIQETWISVMRGVTRLQDPARYRSWLFRIAHNKCIDARRDRGPVREVRDEDLQGGAHVQAVDNRKTIDTILAVLTEDHRAVLALHYLYDMEVADIADLLGIPAGTVKSRLFNAREAFRRALENEGGESNERPGPEDRAGPEGRYRFSWRR